MLVKKKWFILPVFLVALFFASCCPSPDSNDPPRILPLPEFTMSQNQNYILNLASYVADDSDFGERLVWSFVAAEESPVSSVIDQPKQLLMLSSGVLVGVAEIVLTVADSEGLVSAPQTIRIEVKESIEAQSTDESVSFAFDFKLRPDEAGFIDCDHPAGSYLLGTEMALCYYPADGWRLDYWEGPVSDAFANPISVSITSDTLIVAVCSSFFPPEAEVECDIDSPEIFFRFMVLAADTGGDGELSWEEIKAKFPKLSILYRPLLTNADADESGQVSETEFASSAIPEFLLALKGNPDENGDNAITQQELSDVISGVSVDDFRLLDTNSNGVLDCGDL